MRATPSHIWPRSRLLGELFIHMGSLFFARAQEPGKGGYYIWSSSTRSLFEDYNVTDSQFAASLHDNMFQ